MSLIVLSVALFLAIFWSIFLFWRACKHELIDAQDAFDITIVALIGSTVGARIFDFVENTRAISLSKLIFFNAYGSFDFHGAIIGAGIATFLYLRHKRIKTLHVLDLAAAPIIFGQSIFNLVRFLADGWESGRTYGLLSLGYFIIFLTIKRLEARKRHSGFFIAFWLASISILNIIVLSFSGKMLSLAAFISFGFLTAALIFWYIFSGRKFKKDIKNIFAYILLSIFRFKRMVTSVDEAGKFSRSIVLMPLFVSKVMLSVIKLVFREIRLGFVDLLYVFGIKHDRY